MTLPTLAQWEATRTALHQAAQVVGAIRKQDAAPLPNYLHLALEVAPYGPTSGKMAARGNTELVLNMAAGAIDYRSAEGHNIASITINGHTQTSLIDAVLDAMAKDGQSVQPDRAKIGGTEVLNVDDKLAADYQAALYSIYTAMARFKARLFGGMSRMVVWPHGFDLSFLWFARGFDESRDPHLNFGFSPGSAGFPRPYVYAYAHPKPPSLTDIPLSPPARWITEPWTGIVIDYDTLAAESNTESTLEALLLSIHAALSPLL